MKKIVFSQSSLKIILIFLLVLLFLIPIGLINNLIQDRKNYQNEAIESITEPVGGVAYFQGLVIAVPYKSYNEIIDSQGGKHETVETKYIIFSPDSSNMNIEVNPYYLTRGIFKVPVYNGKITLQANFENFDYSVFNIKDSDIIKNEAILILGLSNTKNLMDMPEFIIGENKLSLSPVKYDSGSPFNTSVYFKLDAIDISKPINLSGNISFQGGETIRIQPLASSTKINMSSTWTSPSFKGGWLPTERNLNEDGFTSEWNIAGLSTVFPKSWLSDTNITGEYIDVSFLVPVDSYQKTTRSVKYALLFLVIPFIALLICEIFSKCRIHPVQYCLIGFADIIFYLLLLSISEHIQFDLTYFICAVSVSVLTFLYTSAIFKKIKWGALVSAVQLVSYIFLYGTLQAEDYALLIGSIGLFVVLALLMFITRKIDWYGLNQGNVTDKIEP